MELEVEDPFLVFASFVALATKVDGADELRELPSPALRLVRLPRGARFLARCDGTAAAAAKAFAAFSEEEEEEAWRLARDDVVEDEKEERRCWFDISRSGGGGETSSSTRIAISPRPLR